MLTPSLSGCPAASSFVAGPSTPSSRRRRRRRRLWTAGVGRRRRRASTSQSSRISPPNYHWSSPMTRSTLTSTTKRLWRGSRGCWSTTTGRSGSSGPGVSGPRVRRRIGPTPEYFSMQTAESCTMKIYDLKKWRTNFKCVHFIRHSFNEKLKPPFHGWLVVTTARPFANDVVFLGSTSLENYWQTRFHQM